MAKNKDGIEIGKPLSFAELVKAEAEIKARANKKPVAKAKKVEAEEE